MKKSTTFLFAVLMKCTAFSQDTTAFTIDKAGNKFVYAQSTIKIFNGQRISIKSSNLNGKLIQLELIDTTGSKITGLLNIMTNVLQQNSEKNITIDINTVQKDDGKLLTCLIVNNPYKGTMTYKAKFFSSKTNGYIETSIYPVPPGISGIETWPYIVADLILYDFTIKE